MDVAGVGYRRELPQAKFFQLKGIEINLSITRDTRLPHDIAPVTIKIDTVSLM